MQEKFLPKIWGNGHQKYIKEMQKQINMKYNSANF